MGVAERLQLAQFNIEALSCAALSLHGTCSTSLDSTYFWYRVAVLLQVEETARSMLLLAYMA